MPVINGEFQRDGKQYKASSFSADGNGVTEIEFAEAYTEGVVNRLIRKAEFSLEDGHLAVTDTFEATEALGQKQAYFTETLVTQGKVLIKNNSITIQGKNASCLVQIDDKFQNLRCVEKTHSNHEGEQENVRLVQWEVMPDEKNTPAGEKGTKYHGISKFTIWLG